MLELHLQISHDQPTDRSPEIPPGREGIRYHLAAPRRDDGFLRIDFAVSYLFPEAMSARYTKLGESLSLVWVDVEERGVEVMKLDIHVIPRGEPVFAACVRPPPLPFPGRGAASGGTFVGGWVNGSVYIPEFPGALTLRGKPEPRLFSYVVLENFFSNVAAVDLLRGSVDSFES